MTLLMISFISDIMILLLEGMSFVETVHPLLRPNVCMFVRLIVCVLSKLI